MLEDRTSLVQQVVNAEFDTTFDYPAERAIMMVDDIVHEEWIVEAVCVYSG